MQLRNVPNSENAASLQIYNRRTREEAESLTNHMNFIHMFKPPASAKSILISRLYRWVLVLQAFNLTVIHVKGRTNKVADSVKMGSLRNSEA